MGGRHHGEVLMMLLAAGVFGTTKERRRSVKRMFVWQEDSGLGELGCDFFGVVAAVGEV